MKTNLILALSVFLFTGNAHAYVTGAVDPVTGEGEKEYRAVKKSETAGVSDAVSKGDILLLDTVNNNDGYTVTRVGATNVATTAKIVCIAAKAIATGNTGLVRCVSKGYVDYLKYDSTGVNGTISVGQKLCVNSVGAAVPCAACDVGIPGVNNCALGTATDNSPITSLSAKAGTSGTDLKAVINAK